MPKFQHGTTILHYELEGSGPDALYISGLASHSNDLLAQSIRQKLSPHYRILAVDNRGAGQTTWPVGDRPTLQDMVDDIVAVMDHVGMKSVRLLGVSMGGMIGLKLATSYPERVERQVLAVTAARSFGEDNRSTFFLRTEYVMRQNNVSNEVLNRLLAIMLMGESVFTDMPEVVNGLVNAPPDPMQQPLEGLELQMNAVSDYDVREQLKTLNIPTLVLSSTEDIVMPPRYQDEIVTLIPGAQIKRYLGGHIYMSLPPYVDQFYEDVLGFFAGA